MDHAQHWDKMNEENDAHQKAIDKLAEENYKAVLDGDSICFGTVGPIKISASAQETKEDAIREAVSEHAELLLLKAEHGAEELGKELMRQYDACLQDLCRVAAEKVLG